MMQSLVDKLYGLTDKGLLRALSLLLALVMAGAIFWDPSKFAANTSSLTLWQGGAVIWAVCCAMIHGVGFTPKRWGWRLFFLPLPAIVILIIGLSHIFV